MWIRLPNGRDELVVNEDHIIRLLSEGGVETVDPRLGQSVAIESGLAAEENKQPENTNPSDEQEPITRPLLGDKSKRQSKRAPRSNA